jgi:glycosyltransferase involved in cell wall biosynthesis
MKNSRLLKVAILTTDNRDHWRKYNLPEPVFGPAIEALLQGFALFPDRIQLHVISATQRPLSIPAHLGPNIFYHSLVVPKIGWLKSIYLGCILAVRRKLVTIKPDIVHAQGTERDCAISAVFAFTPKVLTIHGNIRAIAKTNRAPVFSFWWLQARLEGFVLPFFDCIFCNSKHTRSIVLSSTVNTRLVPNALRLPFFSQTRTLRPDSKIPRFIVIGSIVPNKRPLEILRALESLFDTGLPFLATFVGTPGRDTYGNRFLSAVAKAKRMGWLTIKNWMPESELINLMDSSDALIHFPMEEAFGLVVAEALARGLKIFASKVGGIVDIAEGVPDLELFDSGDWSSLEFSIRSWILNPIKPSPFAQEIMKSRYHPKVIASQHLDIYQSIINDTLQKNDYHP